MLGEGGSDSERERGKSKVLLSEGNVDTRMKEEGKERGGGKERKLEKKIERSE